MMEQPWSTRPFLVDQQLRLPVFNFISGNFTGDVCSKFLSFSNPIAFLDLDQEYFNNPLRRDIVKRVFHYFAVKGVKLNKRAKTKGDVAGSGKKPAP